MKHLLLKILNIFNINKANNYCWPYCLTIYIMVETKRIELSTLRMRTVRSPKRFTYMPQKPPENRYSYAEFCHKNTENVYGLVSFLG